MEFHMKPYPDQINAVNAALKHHRGTISMPTGTGKSLVIRLIIEALGLPTLVVVPTLEIKRQMQYTLSGLKNVTVENIDSKALSSLTTRFSVLILDEAHHAAAKTYHRLNKHKWNGIYYRFMLSATPYRNDTEETLLFEAICGEVIYKLSYRDAIRRSYIAPVEAYYLEVPKQPTDAFSYREVYDQLVIHNETRNLMIGALLGRLDKPTLCLVREVIHGKILSEMTGFPFVSGEDDESRDYIRQFNSGEIKTLIGTTGILGEGIDSRPAEYVVVAGLGKAKSAFQQQIGRGVRNYPGKDSAKVIIFRDKSHKYLIRHYNAQKKILFDEYGVIPVKLTL
jgi:superfamily II DNA or RNA helicase